MMSLIVLLIGLDIWFSNELIFAHRKQKVLFLFLREFATYIIFQITFEKLFSRADIPSRIATYNHTSRY